MIFDKNQKKFPSEKHIQIWGYGTRIMPEELVLSDKVRAFIGDDMLESCRQMRLFLLHSLSEMYENAERYDFETVHYMFLWFWLNRKPVVGTKNFAICSVHNKKLCDLNQMEKYCRGIFAETGVEINYINDTPKNKTAEITNALYPKMFCAMKKMFDITRTKKDSSAINDFFNCDFRILCPEYKKDKGEYTAERPKPENIAAGVAGQTQKRNILDFIDFLRSNKLSPQWSATNAAKEHTWNLGIKGKSVFIIRINEITGNWWISIFGWSFDLYNQHITDIDLQKFLLETVVKRCCKNAPQCKKRRKNEPLFGVVLNNVCFCHAFRISNPDGENLENAKKLILETKTILAKQTETNKGKA
jgi:hypothetical protein